MANRLNNFHSTQKLNKINGIINLANVSESCIIVFVRTINDEIENHDKNPPKNQQISTQIKLKK